MADKLPVPAKPIRLPRNKFQMLKQAFISTGLWEAIQVAVEEAPDLLDKLYASMTDSGVKPEDLKGLRDTDSRKLMLVELARAGVPISATAGLNNEEYKKYLSMLREFGVAVMKVHDGEQIARPSSGDAKLDLYAFHQSMARVANRLGLSGPSRFRQLYEIAQVINMITEKDVESVELFEFNFPNALRG